MERLRQEFEGNRKFGILRNWQRDFVASRAIEIAQFYKSVDNKNCGQPVMVRFFDGARSDAYRDDPDRVILVEDSMILGRGKHAVESGVPRGRVGAVRIESSDAVIEGTG